ncbi:MAG TPA: exodeoxyribonuclease III [Acidobacteriota bacterium]|nr:exodeoxyribonuclease III [Acidobacteriota bacterium]
MKLISWNVNGIRSALGKGFVKYVEEEKPDIICLQETKIDQSKAGLLLDGYPYMYWNFAEKKGYSGTAIFSKIKPHSILYGIDKEHHDKEGRVITAEYDNFFLVTVYTPNSKRELLRLDYRKQWDIDFLAFVRGLEKKKPVIFCGDLNCAHTEKDIKNAKANYNKTAGYTQTEIDGFDNMINAGFIDTYRSLYPDKIEYSWWSVITNARSKNIGWRIDYFLVSKSLKDKVQDAFIRTQVLGSDHCPVGLILKE